MEKKPLDTIEVGKPERWVFSNADEDRPTILVRTPLPPLPPKKKNLTLWILATLLIIAGIVSAYYFMLYLPSRQKNQTSFKQTEDISVKEKEIVENIEKKEIKKQEEIKEKADIKKKEDIKKQAEIKKKEAAALRKAKQKQLLEKKDHDAFRQAVSRNVFYSYENYLKAYPSGLHAEEARKHLNEMKYASQLENKVKDDVAFETASKSGTFASYQEYLKQFPYGAHVSESKTRIDYLKQKLIKETKIKIAVISIKFFESGSTVLPMAQRNYTTRFSKEIARYIYTELSFKNKLYGVSASSGAVTLQYNDTSGPYSQPLKGRIDSDIDETTGIYSRGLGFPGPGKWQRGVYTVTIYIDDVEAGKSRFEIY